MKKAYDYLCMVAGYTQPYSTLYLRMGGTDEIFSKMFLPLLNRDHQVTKTAKS